MPSDSFSFLIYGFSLYLTFISFISDSLPLSIHFVDDNVNSFSVIKMVSYALYDNFDLSCSINTYRNFFSLLRLYSLFNSERKWVKCLQIWRHFPLGLLQTSTSDQNGYFKPPCQYNGILLCIASRYTRLTLGDPDLINIFCHF